MDALVGVLMMRSDGWLIVTVLVLTDEDQISLMFSTRTPLALRLRLARLQPAESSSRSYLSVRGDNSVSYVFCTMFNREVYYLFSDCFNYV